MNVRHPHCTPGLSAYQTLLAADGEARRGNQQRLLDLKRGHGSQIAIFCSHDAAELKALQQIADSPNPGPRDATLPESVRIHPD
jgi:hypothetical protein